jgi:MGT family glycosyltransferase
MKNNNSRLQSLHGAWLICYFRASKKTITLNHSIIMSYNISSIQPGTKVLFANVPADGHFNPLTGLAVHLKSIGCDVRWYTSKTYEEKVKRLGFPFYSLKRAVDISATSELDFLFPDRNKYKTQIGRLKFDMINVFILRGTEYYEDIKEIYEEFDFELMIADITFAAIPFVKEKMNIPVISISVVPLPETSKDLPPSGLGLTPDYSSFGRMKQRVLRFVADTLLFAKPTRVMRKILADHGIDAGNANIFDILIQKSTIVLQSGTPGFEYKRSDISENIFFAGPVLPYANGKQKGSAWDHEKLSKYDKVILVTQGTVEKDVEKLIVPTLEAFQNSDCLIVVTTGGSGTEELRKKYRGDNILIEDFIPFDDIMPYADVYVTNGGYGGVLLSIQNQLPMVVAGVHEGKNEINARVGYFRLGINLKTEKPSVMQLRRAVEEILANDTYGENVKSLSQEFRKFNPNEVLVRQVTRLLRFSQKQKVKEEAFIY